MRTQRLGVVGIDETAVRADLARIGQFQFSEPYYEFVCGKPSKSVMLWAPGGKTGDGVISQYDQDAPSRATEVGEGLPYLRSLIENYFIADRIRFARLAVLASNVLVPHRDFVEFEGVTPESRPVHRLHVPLATNKDCYFSEDDVVYQMKPGEVWFLDVTKVHSAAAMTDHERVHLIVDFVDSADNSELVRFPVNTEAGVPADSIVPRAQITDRELAALRNLSEIIDVDNYRDVFAILIKKFYRVDGGPEFFWGMVGEIAAASGDEQIKAKIDRLRDYFVLARDE